MRAMSGRGRSWSFTLFRAEGRYFWPPVVVLAVICYVPLLLSRPGRVTGDTLDGLYLDPSRTFLDAANRWDPGVSFGAVVDRTFGAAFPMSPYYWLTDLLGVPVWLAQRGWMGSILLAAALGVVSLLRVMGWDGPAWIVAPITYVSAPYILSQLGTQSVTLLAFAALPWLVSFTVAALDGSARNPWRDPARFGVVVGLTLSGSFSAFLGILPGPLLWVFYVVVATREVPWRHAAAVLGRIVATSAAASAWWFIGLLSRPRAEVAFARERDPVERVASASIPSETIRSLGDWRFYTHFGRSSLDAGYAYQRVAPVILVSFLPVAVALLTIGRHRFRNRIYFVSLFAMGVVLSSGMSPAGDPEAYGRLLDKITSASIGSFLLPTARCAPLTALAVSVAFAAGIRYIIEVVPDRAGPVTIAASLVAMAGVPAFYTGHALDGPLLLADDVPAYWHRAADDLDGRDPGFGVLEVPGLLTSEYEWGTTRQPVSMALMTRTVALRTPDWPSQPATSDLLAALDEAGSTGALEPEAVAPLARLLGVDTILLRRDTPADDGAGRRWQTVLNQAVAAGGLRLGSSYGYEDGDVVPDGVDSQNPQLYVYEVVDPEPLIRLIDPQNSVVLAGTGPGLVSLANLGIVIGREAVRYAASLDPEEIAQLPPGTPVVVADSSRWTEVSSGQRDPITDLESPVFDSARIVRSDQPQPISGMGPADLANAAALVPELTIDATSFHRSGVTTPQYRPTNAFDGDPETLWITQQPRRPGEALFATFTAPGSVPSEPGVAAEPPTSGFRGNAVVLRQPGPERGFALVGSVRIRTGTQTSPAVELTEASWSEAGQRIELEPVPEPYERFEIEILSVTGSEDAVQRGAGFSEVRLVDDELLDATRRVDPVELVVTPTLPEALAARTELPMAFLFERWEAATDTDESPETRISRVFPLASKRTFAVTVRVNTELPRLGSECAQGVLTIDRVPVELRFAETVNGRAVGRGTTTLDPADRHTLLASAPPGCELEVDGVLLSDGVGRRTGPTRPVAADFIVDQTSATSFQLSDVSVPRPLWLTLGASFDTDWAGGGLEAAGPPELLNGFAASWYLDAPADAPFIFTARWTPQRVVSVGVIISVLALVVLLGLALVPSWKPSASSDLLTPETLRAGNSNVVVLSVLGVFGIAAGTVPAILAACAALLLEVRPQYHRRISWSAPMLLGVAAVAKAARALTGESDGLAALAGPRWIEIVTYTALALAVTAALANTERPPIRRYPVEPM